MGLIIEDRSGKRMVWVAPTPDGVKPSRKMLNELEIDLCETMEKRKDIGIGAQKPFIPTLVRQALTQQVHWYVELMMDIENFQLPTKKLLWQGAYRNVAESTVNEYEQYFAQKEGEE